MVRMAPRLSHRLVAAVDRLDDGKMPLAELTRLVGAEAARLGLPRPSYERVRTIANERRAERELPTTGEVLWDVAWRARPQTDILKQISGTLPAK
jgi:hypothetical protein